MKNYMWQYYCLLIVTVFGPNTATRNIIANQVDHVRVIPVPNNVFNDQITPSGTMYDVMVMTVKMNSIYSMVIILPFKYGYFSTLKV